MVTVKRQCERLDARFMGVSLVARLVSPRNSCGKQKIRGDYGLSHGITGGCTLHMAYSIYSLSHAGTAAE